MNFAVFDPAPSRNEYCSFYFSALQGYAAHNGKAVKQISRLEDARNCTLFVLTDYLTDTVIAMLKNNGVRIAGFNVTDSSYISEACALAVNLSMIDLIFMLSGVQTKNEGFEMVVKPDFTIGLEKREFLPASAWIVFDYMRRAGRLQSLPYVHWDRQVSAEPRPWAMRNKQVLIRGGHHVRRFILALMLHKQNLLDCNSGFLASAYFSDAMTHQFRYCDECRAIWKRGQRYPVANTNTGTHCLNPKWKNKTLDMSQTQFWFWNNRCPESFYALARAFNADMPAVETMLNQRWITHKKHFEMLARITFTSDLKWLFSVYAAQRFWDAASVGCVNFLPNRTNDQQYFPQMRECEHYRCFDERLGWLKYEAELSENGYCEIATQTKELYERWIKATDFPINTMLLEHIFKITEMQCNY